MLKVRVKPGDNITLYCDCNISSGVYIVWNRKCSHENQPSLILVVDQDLFKDPHFQFVRNFSSNSYDLLITNITDSDEGLYYCGTKQSRVEDKEYITQKYVYRYGNVTTRILLDSCVPQHDTPLMQDCGVCWTLLFSLCPAFAVLSSLLSGFLVYHLCRKKAKEPEADQQRPQTRMNQDEDVCYAAVEIRQASQRSKKKKTQSSDFCTYSAINTSRM
ncbi:hypothetical protein PFLUV_G00008730 [Perca fluviatilis]|uniref:Ig-like domain-containing protein n=2 Tax=Perca fluviatilis TaxID=8168 RepID=A0A6A5EYZ6_PERFL|nr:uncharacterized protein LOC120568214 isoform X2 [Perca fluviatilis]KAF1395167.1 hypothetical protein PFLUV_G00008730 [Perca fluviatilis]